MKNKILVLFVMLISMSGFSQQLNYRTGGNVYNMNNQRLKPDSVRELIKSNQEALALYNAGRNKKTWGNVLFYGGIGLATINLVSAITIEPLEVDQDGKYTMRKSSPTLALVGGAFIFASIAVKTGYTKKIKKALEKHNQSIGSSEKFSSEITLIAGSSGVGIKILF